MRALARQNQKNTDKHENKVKHEQTVQCGLRGKHSSVRIVEVGHRTGSVAEERDWRLIDLFVLLVRHSHVHAISGSHTKRTVSKRAN